MDPQTLHHNCIESTRRVILSSDPVEGKEPVNLTIETHVPVWPMVTVGDNNWHTSSPGVCLELAKMFAEACGCDVVQRPSITTDEPVTKQREPISTADLPLKLQEAIRGANEGFLPEFV